MQGFQHRVFKDFFFWMKILKKFGFFDTGFSRIFRQDDASVSGEWETFYMEERLPPATLYVEGVLLFFMYRHGIFCQDDASLSGEWGMFYMEECLPPVTLYIEGVLLFLRL